MHTLLTTELLTVPHHLERSENPLDRCDYNMDDLRAENRRLRAALRQTQCDVMNLSRALENLTTLQGKYDADHVRAEQLALQLAQQQAEMMRMNEQSEIQRIEYERQQTILGECRKISERLEAAVEDHCASVERLACELDAIHNSSSWRVTRPLRWFKELWSRATPAPFREK